MFKQYIDLTLRSRKSPLQTPRGVKWWVCSLLNNEQLDFIMSQDWETVEHYIGKNFTVKENSLGNTHRSTTFYDEDGNEYVYTFRHHGKSPEYGLYEVDPDRNKSLVMNDTIIAIISQGIEHQDDELEYGV